jgi:DNA-binding NarL/FixJ family response regulator
MADPTLVALVDDHTLLRNGLAALIDSFQGYSVLMQADNGKDFIESCRTGRRPYMVLLDITMPHMNGYETALWIRENLPEARILALSMMDNESAVIRMVHCGARGYVLKDCKPAMLKAALDQVRDHGYFINDLVSNRIIKYLQNGDTTVEAITGIDLSDREMTFLRWACTEKTYKEIAREMFISPRTVEGYRDNLFRKLGITTRVGLVVYAIRNGITTI